MSFEDTPSPMCVGRIWMHAVPTSLLFEYSNGQSADKRREAHVFHPGHAYSGNSFSMMQSSSLGKYIVLAGYDYRIVSLFDFKSICGTINSPVYV